MSAQTVPQPAAPTPLPQPAGSSATAGLSDADEIAKLLNALGTQQESVDFVIPAGPGGATRPLGAVLSAPEEKSVTDVDFILPDLRSDAGGGAKEPPIVKLAPSAGTVRLSPAKTAMHGAIRLTGDPTAVPKTEKHGTVRLTGNQPEAAKTEKHGTVRLTGNQTEAAKTEKHGTVRLTGNQDAAAKSEATPSAPAVQLSPVPVEEEKPAPPQGKGKARRKKAPKAKKSSERKSDSLASIVFLLLVILVIVLYVGFFMVRPKILAARAAAQPAPAPSSEPAKPAARKPFAKPAPVAKDQPAPRPVPAAVTPKTAAAKSDQPEPEAGTGKPQPSADVVAKTPLENVSVGGGGGEVDVPEDDGPPPQPSPEPVSELSKPVSKFAPPWVRKDASTQSGAEEPKEEVVIDVPATIDVPEVREWPELRVTAVIGSGKKGSVLVNGNVVSVGEELEEGPVLKAVSRQAAVFEWDGDRRTIYVSSKNE